MNDEEEQVIPMLSTKSVGSPSRVLRESTRDMTLAFDFDRFIHHNTK